MADRGGNQYIVYLYLSKSYATVLIIYTLVKKINVYDFFVYDFL